MDNRNPMPLVSVIVPVYNQAQYVAASLQSICDQDYPNLEILVCDDCSKDETATVVEQFLVAYEGPHVIRFYRNELNKGISPNVNFLIEQSTGQYLCFFAGDDLMHVGKVATQVRYMAENPECFISYHDVDVFESSSNAHLYFYSERHVPRNGGYDVLIRHQSFNCGCANMVRSEPKVYCDTEIRHASDWLHYIDMLYASKGKIHYIPEVLAKYRRHSGNITKTDSALAYAEVMHIFDLLTRRYPGQTTLVSQIRGERMMTYGVKFLIGRHFIRGITTFVSGMVQHPRAILLFSSNLFKFVFAKR
ncbi:glycosyltransferase [Pseudomonas sp. HR96]|uniref:glycosyltransferase family 2 protein n=1 Tax=Pseudomonas sp. HR96 TaxID=1027966 RepID=UPI002A764270|nr:glycosyltransferase [Pseudomonas sp. HR96]WPO98865.1 glycosyltransferase [Pseudomonas sp. HR96]